MDIEITFPGGARVAAHLGGFTIETDQPLYAGGDGSAPTPFALFLASVGTCAGFYVMNFCQQRGIPTDSVRVVQHTHTDRATGMVGQIDLDIQLPPDFPEKYRAAVVRAAELCTVKQHLETPPAFNVYTSVPQPVPA